MYFQIKNIIIWPKNEIHPPRIVNFSLGKLNIITGSSRSGKSAIIPIIDYCLASTDCAIPIDTIRDFALWYGVTVKTRHEEILICRKVPNGTKSSDEFYTVRSKIISIPASIQESNEKTDGVKHILNTIASVPYFSTDGGEDKSSYNSRLSFRDLMAFTFQNQDIIANQNIIFYKTHAHEHRERLRNWFPFILGAENIDTLIARQQIQITERRLNQLRKELEKANKVSNSWLANILGHLKVAKEYGLVKDTFSETTSNQQLIAIAKSIVEEIPDHPNTESHNIIDATNELYNLFNENDNLDREIAVIKKRIGDIKRLKSGFVDYGEHVRRRSERLHISRWLEDLTQESGCCPTCGSAEHPFSRIELQKISTAFKKYESEANTVAEVPTSFSREDERTSQMLNDLIDRKKLIQNQIAIITQQNKEASAELLTRKNMFLFLGHLRASLETFESLVDGGDIQKEIELHELEHLRLLKKIDNAGLKRRIDTNTQQIAQLMLGHLQHLDVEDKYRKVAPKFSIRDLNISVLSNDENWHFLAEVGSASNWVAFHIALMCSLQEFFINKQLSCVPSFVVFDQPSQVYFPKLQKNIINNDMNDRYLDEDVIAVKKIFETINNSILLANGAWQAIILDHADNSIYGDIDGINEVEVWRNGTKLIPEEWYIWQADKGKR